LAFKKKEGSQREKGKALEGPGTKRKSYPVTYERGKIGRGGGGFPEKKSAPLQSRRLGIFIALRAGGGGGKVVSCGAPQDKSVPTRRKESKTSTKAASLHGGKKNRPKVMNRKELYPIRESGGGKRGTRKGGWRWRWRTVLSPFKAKGRISNKRRLPRQELLRKKKRGERKVSSGIRGVAGEKGAPTASNGGG